MTNIETKYPPKRERKRGTLDMGEIRGTIKQDRFPLYVETFYLVEGLEDEEEEKILKVNQDLIPRFMVHVDELIKR